MRRLLILVLCAAAMTGCGSKLKKENEKLAEEIAQRKGALKEHQSKGLANAQRELAVTDSLLEVVEQQHAELHLWVMEHSKELNDASPEVVRLNGLRQKRDSLKGRFQVLAETIKYIKKRSEANTQRK